MVTLNRIYTKTGDRGKTSLGTGERVDKHSIRVESYGTVDELNAAVGVTASTVAAMSSRKFSSLCVDDISIENGLNRISNDLFDLGADLCRPFKPDADDDSLRIISKQTSRLETEIKDANSKLEPLNSFVLPGGNQVAAHLHMCRTIARRAERRVVELSQSEDINPETIKYLNRLSDWFFVYSRLANNRDDKNCLWVPGMNM